MGSAEQQIQNVDSGTVILREGQISHGVYILLQGRVVISRLDDFGRDLVLAELSEGEVFGEMGLVSNQPCSATVTTVGDVQVRYFSNEEFVRAMSNNFASVENVLRTLFQRMRNMNLRVMELEKQLEAQVGSKKVAKKNKVSSKSGDVTLSGQTEPAKHVLDGVERFVIEKYPFRIGRWSAKKMKTAWFLGSDENDLDIHDIPPYSISRHHCHFERNRKGVFIVDDSRLGVWLNGERVKSRDKGVVKARLEPGVYTLSLGSIHSVFTFEMIVW